VAYRLLRIDVDRSPLPVIKLELSRDSRMARARSLAASTLTMVALYYLLILFVAIVYFFPTFAHANAGFQFDDVAALAKKIAAEPFRQPQPIPKFLTALSYDDYRDIRFDTKQSSDSGTDRMRAVQTGRNHFDLSAPPRPRISRRRLHSHGGGSLGKPAPCAASARACGKIASIA
jgi:hypothetical protein